MSNYLVMLFSYAYSSREAQSRYPKITNIQRNSSIHRTIELSNPVPTTNVVVNEYLPLISNPRLSVVLSSFFCIDTMQLLL